MGYIKKEIIPPEDSDTYPYVSKGLSICRVLYKSESRFGFGEDKESWNIFESILSGSYIFTRVPGLTPACGYAYRDMLKIASGDGYKMFLFDPSEELQNLFGLLKKYNSKKKICERLKRPFEDFDAQISDFEKLVDNDQSRVDYFLNNSDALAIVPTHGGGYGMHIIWLGNLEHKNLQCI